MQDLDSHSASTLSRSNDNAVLELAAETKLPVPVVKRYYDAELQRLEQTAKVKDYVPLFARRRTRDRLIGAGPDTIRITTGDVVGRQARTNASRPT
jgi:hypothetical protein